MRALHKLSVRDGKPMIQHTYKIINKPLTLLMFLLLTACNSSDNTVSESSHVDQVVQNNTSSVDASNSTEIVNGEDLTEIGHLPTSNSTILASSDDSELTSEPPTLVAFTEAIASQPEGSSFNEETRDANDSQTSIEESDSISLSPLGDPVALNTAVNQNPEETTTQVSSASNDV